MPKDIDEVYRERNLLAIAFTRAWKWWLDTAFPNHDGQVCGYWPDPNVDINGEATVVVWAYTTEGQVGYHIPQSMCPDWLPLADPEFDGHGNDIKNRRVEAFANR